MQAIVFCRLTLINGTYSIGKPAQSRIHDAASKGDTEEVILLSKTKPDDCLKKLDTLGVNFGDSHMDAGAYLFLILTAIENSYDACMY